MATERLLAHLLSSYPTDTMGVHDRPVPIQLDIRPTSFSAVCTQFKNSYFIIKTNVQCAWMKAMGRDCG